MNTPPSKGIFCSATHRNACIYMNNSNNSKNAPKTTTTANSNQNSAGNTTTTTAAGPPPTPPPPTRRNRDHLHQPKPHPDIVETVNPFSALVPLPPDVHHRVHERGLRELGRVDTRRPDSRHDYVLVGGAVVRLSQSEGVVEVVASGVQEPVPVHPRRQQATTVTTTAIAPAPVDNKSVSVS